MKLLHNSIDLAKTDSIKLLKEQVSDSVHIQLRQQDMNGFFGDFLRYVNLLDDSERFYEFDKPENGETDWAIMKACFANAADLDTIVHYKYAVWKENEGWRCVSGGDAGMEYLWYFFEPDIEILKEFAADVIQKKYNGELLNDADRQVYSVFFTRFEDWIQVIAKIEELRSKSQN